MVNEHNQTSVVMIDKLLWKRIVWVDNNHQTGGAYPRYCDAEQNLSNTISRVVHQFRTGTLVFAGNVDDGTGASNRGRKPASYVRHEFHSSISHQTLEL